MQQCKRQHSAGAVVLASVIFFTPQVLANLAYVPEGLSTKEWQGIQEYIAQAQYHAHQSDQGFLSSNQAHGFQAEFSKNGSTSVTTGGANIRFRLISESAKPRYISSETNTVTYHWSDNLREWWVNDEGGLEQWFEVKERPEWLAPDAPLQIDLELESSLNPELRNNQLLFSDAETAITYNRLVVWDSTGHIFPAEMMLQGSRLSFLVDDTNALYPITIDPTLSQQAYVKASNTGGNDGFSRSLAIDGDTLIVGARYEDSNATGINGNQADNTASNSGAAYVFTRAGTTWSQQAYLKASNTGDGDNFGISVAISGDTVVVGAAFEDSNATGVNGNQANNAASSAGAAYVFTRSGTTWSQQAYLKASNTGSGDLFGLSVAADGDTVVVGSYSEDSNATGVNGNQANNLASNSGAAYVFFRSGTSWSQQAYLKASNSDVNDWFGTVVDLDGDTIVVGAPGEDSNTVGINGNQANNSSGNSGAAYVFTRADTIWSQQAYLKASNTDSDDFFGVAVTSADDTIIVSAVSEDSNATGVNGDQADNSALNSGAAYAFTRSGTTWIQQAYIKASNTDAGDDFGRSVSLDSDNLVVGAGFEDSNATGVNGDQTNNSASVSGAAYVFERNGSSWSQKAYLKASNTGNSDRFGFSVAAGSNTIVVGAPEEDSNATGVNGDQANNVTDNSGAVYVFAPSASRRIIVTGY